MGLKVTIIGCGYVGMAVARQWRESGHEILATTTTRDRVAELEKVAQQVAIVRGDDLDALRSVVRDRDVVLLSVGARHPNTYRETYLDTAKNLVTVLQDAPGVKQVIYTGSYSVYGDKKGQWVDETAPIAPIDDKDKILFETERVLLGVARDRVKTCVLRLGGIYGPDREIVKIFGRVAGTTRPGTGQEWSNWIHLQDIVAAIAFVCEQRCEGIYNLVNDVPLPLGELLDRLCELHGLATVSWDPSRPSLRSHNVRVSNRKLKAAGFQLNYPETML